ncbi:MAG: DUF2254 domain-containing protein [Myxococcota bacterium]|nr:DUF2254 domain-containing protein [Myxococcota bacterium]
MMSGDPDGSLGAREGESQVPDRHPGPRLAGAGLAAGALLGTAMALYGLVSWLEGFGFALQTDPSQWLAGVDRAAALDAVGNAAEVISALLAIVITVVAIVVELAATRYTHRITELFIREPINVLVLSFFVLTTVLCLWIAATFGGELSPAALLPQAALWLPLLMLTICLVILLPYFAFVFAFVSPLNTIRRLRVQALKAIRSYPKRGEKARLEVLTAIEELADLARGSLQHKDRTIAMAVSEAFSDLLQDFWRFRDELPDSFFALDGVIARDPDFVAVDWSVRQRLGRRGSWLEVKILRQFLELFANSLGQARDVGSFLAIKTRNLAVESGSEGRETLALCMQFFNSYMRAAINGRDLRLAYYVLDQYRQLAEELISRGDSDGAIQIGHFMRYYGQVAYDAGLQFLIETVAYDLFRLIEFSEQKGAPATDPLLSIFLEVDRPEESPSGEEDRLLGVRRVQAQLAAALLARGDRARARLIQQDMAEERPERLRLIRDELARENRPAYWEFTDRGVNFSYLPPEARACLDEFFAPFDLPDRVAPTTPVPDEIMPK